jgi:hypothetical protein
MQAIKSPQFTNLARLKKAQINQVFRQIIKDQIEEIFSIFRLFIFKLGLQSLFFCLIIRKEKKLF